MALAMCSMGRLGKNVEHWMEILVDKAIRHYCSTLRMQIVGTTKKGSAKNKGV
jgi:hypothetical protein